MMVLRALFAFLVLLVSTDVVLAANRVAMVIGNDNYQELPKLQRAVNDAKAVAAALRTIDFRVEEGFNLTRREFNERFSAFVRSLEPGDTAFFFFAGHGVASRTGRNILLPVDVPMTRDIDIVQEDGHVVDELVERVKDSGAIVSMFVLDACRNNPFDDGAGRTMGIGRGLQGITPPRGTFVLMAAGTNQEALDRLPGDDPNPNSLFTRHLLPLLTTPGITHTDLAKEVQTKVEAEARKFKHAQQPAFYDQVSGYFYLVEKTGDPGDLASEGATRESTPGEGSQPAALEQSEIIVAESDERSETADGRGGAGEVAALDTREAGVTLALAIQEELKRVGCYAGRVDGIWGKQSGAAFSSFIEHGGANFIGRDPTLEALSVLRSRKSRVCPLVCGPREQVSQGRCVRKQCPTGHVLQGDGRCKAEARKDKDGWPTDAAESRRACKRMVSGQYSFAFQAGACSATKYPSLCGTVRNLYRTKCQ
jgi:hypothetical protein